MSRLPVIQERTIPNAAGPATTPVVTADTTQIAKAFGGLGQELQQVGGQIAQIKRNNDYIKYSNARSKFYQQLSGLNSQLESAPDYEKIPEAFQQNVGKIKGQLLDELGDNHFKAEFASGVDKIAAQHLSKIQDLAFKRQQSTGLALAEDNEEKNLDSYLRTSDEDIRDNLIVGTIENYKAAIAPNDPNRELLIQTATQKIGQRFALARLNSLPARQQLEVLKQDQKEPDSNFTKLIPADKRIDLMDKAETALEQEKNRATGDLDKANKIRKQNAETTSLKTILGGGTVADISAEDWFRLDEKTRKDLNLLQKEKAGLLQRDQVEGDQAYNDYSELYINNPAAMADVNPIEIQAKVSPDKVNKVLQWQAKAKQGMNAPVDLVAQNKVANQTLNSIGISPTNKKATAFKDRFNEEVDYFKEVHKKDPSLRELETLAHGLIAQATFDGGYFGRTKTIPLYKVARKDVEKQLIIPDDFKNEVLQLRKAKGYNAPVNDDYFKKLYLESLKK